MPLIHLVVVLIVVGVLLWLVNNHIPMAVPLKGFKLSSVVAVVLWLLSASGILALIQTSRNKSPIRMRARIYLSEDPGVHYEHAWSKVSDTGASGIAYLAPKV